MMSLNILLFILTRSNGCTCISFSCSPCPAPRFLSILNVPIAFLPVLVLSVPLLYVLLFPVAFLLVPLVLYSSCHFPLCPARFFSPLSLVLPVHLFRIALLVDTQEEFQI